MGGEEMKGAQLQPAHVYRVDSGVVTHQAILIHCHAVLDVSSVSYVVGRTLFWLLCSAVI